MSMLTLGQTIRQNRERLKMSQKELAHQTDVWDTYISQIEKGEKVPSDDLCLKLGDILEVDYRFLLLSAYTERSRSETKTLFEQMKRLLSDPLFEYLLKIDWITPEILETISSPDFSAAIRDPRWRQVFLDGFRMQDRDIVELIQAVGRMKKVQWEALMNMVKVFQGD